MTNQNRRQHPRADFDWPLTIVKDGETIFGKVINISRGGALIRIPVELYPKEQFRMVIEIPEYDDVISVKGVVIRTSPGKTAEGVPSFASGIMFTEISQEDLRYFTGNLAPEWHKEYREPWDRAKPRAVAIETPAETGAKKAPRPVSRTQKSPWKAAAIALAMVSVAAVAYTALQPVRARQDVTARVVSLESRLQLLEEQKSLDHKDTALITELKEQITALRSQLTEFQYNATARESMPAVGIDDHPTTEVQAPQKVSDPLRLEHKIQVQPQITLEEKQIADRYHVVQGGENLYRIGLNYQLSVEELLVLNGLKPDAAIHPGQKLLVSSSRTKNL